MPETKIRASRLLIIALASFGLSTVVSRGPTIALIVLGVVSLALSIARRGTVGELKEDQGRWIFAVIALFAIMSLIGPAHQVIGSPPTWIFSAAGLAWLGLGLAWLILRSKVAGRRAIYLLAVLATGVLGAVHILSAVDVGFDVLLLHNAAADAITSGISPYSDAVTVPNGAPIGDPFIVGYPYPPITAFSYTVGDWLFGDPRWTSLIAWLCVLAVIGAPSWRHDGSDVPLGTMLVAAAIPGWPLVLTTGWTESLSLALLALAVASWSRSRMSGALSGLFLGSKQYLLAAAPIYVINRVQTRITRALWSSVALAFTFLPVLVWGLPDFVDAAMRFHLQAPPRADGTSIVGLLDMLGVEWAPPVWMMVLVVLAVSVAIGRCINDVSRWLAALGLILSTALFLSAQAFTNYWYFMAGVAALALAWRFKAPDKLADGTPEEARAPSPDGRPNDSKTWTPR